MIHLSVVVPVHDGGAALHTCMESLHRALDAQDELIVVADGGLEEDCRTAALFGARVVSLPIRRGPAAARNAGAQIARGHLLLFFDADVQVHPDTLDRFRAAFRQDPDLDAAIGSYDDAPAARGLVSQYRNLLHHYVHQQASEEAATFWGACGAIRREVFEAVGGFDPSWQRPSVEDIAFGYRLREVGYRIRLFKDVQVKHLKQWTIRSMIRADVFYRSMPWTELLLRTRRFDNDLNLRTSDRLSVGLACGSVVALLAAPIWPVAAVVAGCFLVSVLVLNRSFYRFLARKQGLGFMLRALPWHLLFYIYSGIGFGLGVLRYVLDPSRRPMPRPSSSTLHV